MKVRSPCCKKKMSPAGFYIYYCKKCRRMYSQAEYQELFIGAMEEENIKTIEKVRAWAEKKK